MLLALPSGVRCPRQTVSSSLGHCYGISGSGPALETPIPPGLLPVRRTTLAPTCCNVIYSDAYLRLNHARCTSPARRAN